MSKKQAATDKALIDRISESKKGPTEFPVVKIPRRDGISLIKAAEEYFGCKATPSSDLPEEKPCEEYLIDFE